MPWRDRLKKGRNTRVPVEQNGDSAVPPKLSIEPSSTSKSPQNLENDASLDASHPVTGAVAGVPPGENKPASSVSAATAVTDSRPRATPAQSVATTISKSQQTWNQAYDSILVDEESSTLANKYIEALTKALGPKEVGADGTVRPVASLDLQDPVKRQDYLKTLIQQGQNKVAYANKITEKIGNVLDFIDYAKGAVDVAVQTNPQAALPWAGVCVGLEILMNPVKSHRSNLEGISYVTARMNWYCALTEHLLSSENISNGSESYEAVQSSLEISIVALYKSILLYQMKSVCKYYRNQGWEFLRGLANLDDWDADLESVKGAEKKLQEQSDQYTNQQVRSHLRALVHAAAERKERLGNIEMTLKDFVTAQMKSKIDKEEKMALQALYVLDPRHDMNDIEDEKDKLLHDAYKWILDTPEYTRFTDWQRSDSQNVRLMWVKGDAGTGKTMLLMGIIRQLSEQSSVLAPHLAYFFCRGTGNKDKCDATTCLRSLIWLLLFQQPQLRTHLLSEYKYKSAAMFTDRHAFAALRAIFLNMLEDVNLSPVYLIVDALDECSEKLDDLLELVSTSLKSTSKVKWLVSGRPEVDVAKLGSSDTLVELDAQRLLQPVASYIKYKLEGLAGKEGYTRQIIDQISEEVKQRAQNTFLWVALVFKELKNVNGWDAIGVVTAMPSQLLDLYNHIMNRIGSEKEIELERCKKVLATATLAYRPLSLAELTTVAGLPAQSAKTYVLKCRSFLMIKESDSTVHLIHQSVKQYLEANFADKLQQGGVYKTHLDLSTRSTAAISQLQRNVYNLPNWGCTRQDFRSPTPDPLKSLRYSCIFWARHHIDAANEGDATNVALTDCIDFLEKSFLIWLECLSLINELEEGIHVIRQLLGAAEGLVVQEDSMSKITPADLAQPSVISRLVELLRDAERFIVSHRSITERGPLQTYTSALVFIPSMCVLNILFWTFRQLLGDAEGRVVQEDSMSKIAPADLAQPSAISRLVELLRDAERFIVSHRSIIERAPLQTYASALVFSPSKSVLKSLFWTSRFPNVAKVSETGDNWDSCLQILEDHRGYVNTVAYSPDGKSLASASSDGTILLWDSGTGCRKAQFSREGAYVLSVAFAPDNQMLASASSDGTVLLWNLEESTCREIFHSDTRWVIEIIFSRKGDILAGALTDSTIQLWNLNTDACQTLKGHTLSVNALAISANGNEIVSASSDHSVCLWDIEGNTSKTFQPHSGAVNTVAFSPDETCIASGSNDRTVNLLWPKDGEERTLGGHSDAVNAVAFSPDGAWLASASGDGTVRIWLITTGVCTKLLKGHQNWVNSIAFSPDGKTLASGSSDRTIRLWETASETQLRDGGAHNGPVNAVSFSSDGNTLASASADLTTRFWDAKTGHCLGSTGEHHSEVLAVAFSNDCSLIATGSGDKTVRLWSCPTGALKKSLFGHLGQVLSLRFSPDDKRLVSGASDWRIRSWDITSGECTQTLEGHQSWVTQLVFSTHGKNIASASTDGTIRLWSPALGGKQLEALGLEQLKNLIYIPGQANLALLQSSDVIKLWDGQTFACRASFTTSAPIWGLSFTQNDQCLETDYEQFHFDVLVKSDDHLEAQLESSGSATAASDPLPSIVYPTITGRGPTWDFLEGMVSRIFSARTGGFPLTVKEYMAAYTAVYNYCTDHDEPEHGIFHPPRRGAQLRGGGLYQTLRDYLGRYLEELVRMSSHVTGEALLGFYNQEWAIYTRSSRYISSIFRFLNTHWISRELSEGRRDLYKIHALHLVLWYEMVLKGMRERIMTHILQMVDEERRGARIDNKQIKDFVDSLIAMREHQASNIYLDEMQTPLLNATKEFYKMEAEQLVTTSGVAEYLQKVERRLDQEEERVRTYLDVCSELPLKRMCIQTLVLDQSETLLKAFPQFLKDGREENMARMHKFFTQGGDHATGLMAPFESRLRKAGLATVLEAGSTDNGAKSGRLLSKFRVPGSGGNNKNNDEDPIFINEEWICRGDEKILWLPSDYRPTCAVCHDDMLVLGHQSGQVTFIKLSRPGES